MLIVGTGQYGNSIRVDSDAEVIGNEVEVTGYDHTEGFWETIGIYVVGGSNAVVKDNHVYYVDNDVSELQRGITVESYKVNQPDAENNLIKNNTVEGLEYGITASGNAFDTTIENNEIRENTIGVASITWIREDGNTYTPSGTEIHYNNIVGNTEFGVKSDSYNNPDYVSAVAEPEKNIDATNNWWGHASGPRGEQWQNQPSRQSDRQR